MSLVLVGIKSKEELIFTYVADAIVGTIIVVFRRITKQTKKKTSH